MYKISVPVTNENVIRCTPQRVFDELKKFNPDRVFLSLGEYELNPEIRRKVLAELRANCEFFKSCGLEVGVWIWAFMMKNSPFTCMKSLKGTDFPQNMCPLDENFLNFAADYDAVFVHAGGSPFAYASIKDRKVNNLDGVNMWDIEEIAFYRSQDRMKKMGYEHSMVSTAPVCVFHICQSSAANFQSNGHNITSRCFSLL